MKVTKFTREALALRKETREMQANGYEQIEVDWKLHRGAKYDHKITFFDAKVSCDGQHVWIKVETARA
jgi:hypothetical protein